MEQINNFLFDITDNLFKSKIISFSKIVMRNPNEKNNI